MTPGEFARHLVNEDADIREGMRADRRRYGNAPASGIDDVTEPRCPEHGYGCEPSACPCGHTLRCDCKDIANEH